MPWRICWYSVYLKLTVVLTTPKKGAQVFLQVRCPLAPPLTAWPPSRPAAPEPNSNVAEVHRSIQSLPLTSPLHLHTCRRDIASMWSARQWAQWWFDKTYIVRIMLQIWVIQARRSSNRSAASWMYLPCYGCSFSWPILLQSMLAAQGSYAITLI